MIPCIYGLKFPWGTSPRKHRAFLTAFPSILIFCPHLITSTFSNCTQHFIKLYKLHWHFRNPCLPFKLNMMISCTNCVYTTPLLHTARARILQKSPGWILSQGNLLFSLTLGTSAVGPAGFSACNCCQRYPTVAAQPARLHLSCWEVHVKCPFQWIQWRCPKIIRIWDDSPSRTSLLNGLEEFLQRSSKFTCLSCSLTPVGMTA